MSNLNKDAKSGRLKYLIGAVAIGGAFLYLIWTSFSASFQFALTPGEFLADQTKYEGRTVKLAGTVATGSIFANGTDYYFRISDNDSREIKVHYKGIAPNTFREGADVVVSGIFNPESDMFESKQMLTKCASKYEGKR